MTEKATEEEYDDEKLQNLYDEIVQERKRFVKRPPRDIAGLVEFIDGSIMSILKDLAHYARDNDAVLSDVFDRVEALEGDAPDVEQETQFTPEDANDFKLLVTFAREQAKQILASGLPEIVEGTQAHGQATMIVSKAEAALLLIDESTLEDDDEDEDDEGEGGEDADKGAGDAEH